MNNETNPNNEKSAIWKARLKKFGIWLLKLICLVYTMKFLWRSIKNFFGLLKAMFSTSQYSHQKASSNRANAWGEGSYTCNGCGRRLAVGIYECPSCHYGADKPVKDPNSKGCFYCLFMLPFNLAMVIISALPLLILLGLIGMAAQAINTTADKPNETTVEVRDAAITAPAEEATPAPELN